MRQPPMLATELTLQLEQHIAPNETQPPEQEGSLVARFGKTIASLERAPWPPSRVFCFNVGDLDSLTEILDFFGDIDPEFMLVHGGFAPEVGQALNSAGYCPHDCRLRTRCRRSRIRIRQFPQPATRRLAPRLYRDGVEKTEVLSNDGSRVRALLLRSLS